MKPPPATPPPPNLGGLWAALAFVIWGVAPAYYKALQQVPAMEILMHRVVWSFLALVPLVLAGPWSTELRDSLRSRARTAALAGTALLISSKWKPFHHR